MKYFSTSQKVLFILLTSFMIVTDILLFMFDLLVMGIISLLITVVIGYILYKTFK